MVTHSEGDLGPFTSTTWGTQTGSCTVQTTVWMLIQDPWTCYWCRRASCSCSSAPSLQALGVAEERSVQPTEQLCWENSCLLLGPVWLQVAATIYSTWPLFACLSPTSWWGTEAAAGTRQRGCSQTGFWPTASRPHARWSIPLPHPAWPLPLQPV